MTNPVTNKTIFIIAGEDSGDMHASELVARMMEIDPYLHFRGIGGSRMRNKGVEILVDASEMAVVGLVEVLVNYRFLSGVLNRMRLELSASKPDLLILVDYPDFNLRLAATAKKLGIPVLYYISPQVWAWRQHRIHKIKRLVDMMAVIFPFETIFYQQAGIPVEYVGHPLSRITENLPERPLLSSEFGLDSTRPVLGLFPGSRKGEISRLLPTILDSATRIKQDIPEVQFILPLSATANADFIKEQIEQSGLDIILVPGRSHDVIRCCDTIICASGTVTLEIALLQVPMVVIYKVSALSYIIMSQLIKISHIALCNIVADRELVPELVQHKASPEMISREVIAIMNNPLRQESIRQDLGCIRERIGDEDAATNVATLAMRMLSSA